MKHLFAVYGTLKEGYPNNYILGKSEKLGTQWLRGFRMHSLGGFPALNKSDDHKVLIEVFEVTDEEVKNRIYRLEGFTGERGNKDNWYETDDVETIWGEAEIFYHKKELTEPVVEKGDWEQPVDEDNERYYCCSNCGDEVSYETDIYGHCEECQKEEV